MGNVWDDIRIKCFLDEAKALCKSYQDSTLQPHLAQSMEEIEYLWSMVGELNEKVVDLEIELAGHRYKDTQIHHPQE